MTGSGQETQNTKWLAVRFSSKIEGLETKINIHFPISIQNRQTIQKSVSSENLSVVNAQARCSEAH